MTSKLTYTPTFLYIKIHSITGKMYFGKTIRDPNTYNGSGIYWNRHIKKYGIEYVETLWYCLFLDKDELKTFAESFSRINKIAESTTWANLISENGGTDAPRLTDKETIRKHISESMRKDTVKQKMKETLLERYGVDNSGKTEKSRTAASNRMKSERNPAYNRSEETRNKISKTNSLKMCTMTASERSEKFGNASVDNAFYGKHHTEETKEILRRANSKGEYKLTSPDGVTFYTISIIDFCKTYNLNRDIFRKYLGKGIIPKPSNFGKESRMNSIGWRIELCQNSIEHAPPAQAT